MIGCLRTRVRKQPIIALYFEFETVLEFYNLQAWYITTNQKEESIRALRVELEVRKPPTPSVSLLVSYFTFEAISGVIEDYDHHCIPGVRV